MRVASSEGGSRLGQLKEYMLCQQCEDQFNVHERIAAHVSWQISTNTNFVHMSERSDDPNSTMPTSSSSFSRCCGDARLLATR